MAHSGWGAGMFAKDVFPEAAFVAYCEWWYRYPAAGRGLPRGARGPRACRAALEAPMHERARNAPIAMDLAASDAAICPTEFQASQFPAVFRRHLSVMHDGIDTDFFRPARPARRSTLGGLRRRGRPRRHLCHPGHGAAPRLPAVHGGAAGDPRADPKAVAVVAGENRVVYGGDALRRVDWKARALAENDIDPARVHFVGHLGREDYLRLLQRSAAHVYLTVPFVLSWSMLEAMSSRLRAGALRHRAGARVRGQSAAAMVDLADPGAIAAAVLDAASSAGRSSPRRRRARAVVERRVARAREFPRKQAWLERLRG